MVQQGVPAGDKEAVRVGLLQRHFARFHAVDAQSPGTDDAFLAQPGQGLGGAVHGDVEHVAPAFAMEVAGGVVNPHDVQAVGLQARQAGLDGAQRAVGGVVVDDLVGQAVLEQAALLAQVALGGVFALIEDQPAHFRAEYVVVAPVLLQRRAQPDLGKARAVHGGGVEVADALLPGGLDGVEGFPLGDVAVHVA